VSPPLKRLRKRSFSLANNFTCILNSI